MNVFGIIGFPLSHSFSPQYFKEKFEKEGIKNAKYQLFEIDSIEKVETVFKTPYLKGLNVTLPYKELVIPFLDKLDESAKQIGAVNVIKVSNRKKIGYNTDYYGFKHSLEKGIKNEKANLKALVLGTGGAAKAVVAVLNNLEIKYKYVSRQEKYITYYQLKEDRSIVESHKLIINTTPLGMYPKIEDKPDLPYKSITSNHFLFDLVYNPIETQFLLEGKKQGAKVKNGLEMLHQQAEEAWNIWNE